jgi:hypothetical protein
MRARSAQQNVGAGHADGSLASVMVWWRERGVGEPGVEPSVRLVPLAMP